MEYSFTQLLLSEHQRLHINIKTVTHILMNKETKMITI